MHSYENVDPQMPPERFSRQGTGEFDETSSLPLQTESVGSKNGRIPRGSRLPRQRPKILQYQLLSVAGAPGFEPGITGSKPGALPLGYAPISRASKRAPLAFSYIWRAAALLPVSGPRSNAARAPHASVRHRFRRSMGDRLLDRLGIAHQWLFEPHLQQLAPHARRRAGEEDQGARLG